MSMLDGVLGLRSWRLLFLVNGLTRGASGLARDVGSDDRPENARFLTDQEKALVQEDMEADRRARVTAASVTISPR